jgi:CRP/FNR family transcriptional regulator, anaerobic regulatory protein
MQGRNIAYFIKDEGLSSSVALFFSYKLSKCRLSDLYCKLGIMKELLAARLYSLHPISDSLIDTIWSVVKVTEYPQGSFILKEGDVCSRVSIIAKGLLRSYYINDTGKEITSRFMDEGSIVTSWMSFYSRTPGNEFIEAMEDSTLLCLEYDSLQQLYNTCPEFNIIGRKQVEHAFFLSEQRTQMLRMRRAEDKYRLFFENHPNLLKRIPLKYVATYLGMTEETFSRVRSKFHRKG